MVPLVVVMVVSNGCPDAKNTTDRSATDAQRNNWK